jgi:RNA polymerase sigma factor (sigma-70 family)
MSPLALSLHFLQAQPDSRLLALAREGHEPAFEALVRRYRKELLSYCRRLQPRSGSAEDALQQTFLQAWRALGAGAEIREARPWLYRIAHNVSLNQLRIVVAVPHEVPEDAGGQEVHQLVEQRLQVRAALAGMASLPPLQRDVFVSTTLDGASHEEVASALGLSSGAVRGLIYRARAVVRSAAAALLPNPAVHWAIRRAASRTGGSGGMGEALTGGGGAGMAAVLAKGGAVLTLAGAVAGAGGMIFTHSSSHHRRSEARVAGHSARAQANLPPAEFRSAIDEPARGFALGVGRGGNKDNLGRASPRAAGERGRDAGSVDEDHGGLSSGSTIDGGERSRGGSDGGSATGATIASSSDGGSTSAMSSGSSDGGSTVSSSTSTSTTSGSVGGTTDGGPGPSGTQLTTLQMTSDGGSGSDGGSSSSSGSGETTTTNSH